VNARYVRDPKGGKSSLDNVPAQFSSHYTPHTLGHVRSLELFDKLIFFG
jgi:hypothetical protein